jgi:hypothetical protein
MDTNADLEMRWIDAWSDLHELASDQAALRCLLPDGTVVGFEDCKGWLQGSVFQGWKVAVKAGWVAGAWGVVVSRWQEG